MKYLMAIDQGTTSSRAILFDVDGKICGIQNKEFEQIYPKPGWVEHDANEILSSQLEVLKNVEADSMVAWDDIVAVGITNQRETVVMWNKQTGQPIHNAIVWQCRRTADICDKLTADGYEDLFRDKTGLIIDAYFSATKVKWLLDNVEGARELANTGNLLMGTIDTWLIWNLTGGRVHATDYTNAARTMLFNIHSLQWDAQILEILDIPASILPEVKSSSDDFGRIQPGLPCGGIPILGVAGDQQSALFGQACFYKGNVKNTYGTGCFLLMNTGDTPIKSESKLLTTIAWGIDGKVTYAMEGSIFMGGASVQWLRDEMQLIQTSAQSEEVAAQVKNTGGVYLVPAFAGLGAPWWDMYARGTLTGMTRGTGRAHVVRATLESIAYQTKDVLDAMVADTNIPIDSLKVDGGASGNNLLMQFQSDLLNIPTCRPVSIETTAWGAACLAGLKAGVFSCLDELAKRWKCDKEFVPNMTEGERKQKYDGWIKAVGMARYTNK